MSQRAIARALEKALGQVVVSKSAISNSTERLPPADDAFRTRDLSGDEVAYLLLDTVYEPLRRGGKTGVMGVWGLCIDGRTFWFSLSTAHSESDERGREVRRDLVKRGLQTPGTITTDGAPGWSNAVDAMWPRALWMRCWFHTMQHRHQQVPPQAWSACKALVADMRAAPPLAEGQRCLRPLLAQEQATLPEACRGLEEDEASRNPLQGPASTVRPNL